MFILKRASGCFWAMSMWMIWQPQSVLPACSEWIKTACYTKQELLNVDMETWKKKRRVCKLHERCDSTWLLTFSSCSGGCFLRRLMLGNTAVICECRSIELSVLSVSLGCNCVLGNQSNVKTEGEDEYLKLAEHIQCLWLCLHLSLGSVYASWW